MGHRLLFSRDTLQLVVGFAIVAVLAVLGKQLLGDELHAPGAVFLAGIAVGEQHVGTMAPTIGANSVEVKMDLPRDQWLGGLLLRLSGTHTVTAGGGNNGTLHDENPMSLIEKIQVEGTGGFKPEILKALSGPVAYRRHHLFEGKESQASPITSAGVQADTAFSATIPIWFMLPGRNLSIDRKVWSALNPKEFDQLVLTLTFGTTGAFQNGGDRVLTVPTCRVDVSALQIRNMKPLIMPGSNQVMRPYRFIETELFEETTAAVVSDGGTEYTTRLGVGRQYRDIMIRTRNEVANARQPVDDVLQRLVLQASETKILDYRNRTQYVERHTQAIGVQTASNPSGLNPLGSRDNPVVGYYMLDFMRDGGFDGVLDTRMFPATGTALKLFRDTAIATSRVHKVVASYFVPGGKAA